MTTEKRYQLFLSYRHADADVAVPIAERLDELGIACYLDQWESIVGESGVAGMEQAMASSDAVAVLVAPQSGAGRWHAEEAVQALRHSVDDGKRAFVVWLPGAPEDPPGLSTWLRVRNHVDLRAEMAGGTLSRKGLAGLVSGALGISRRVGVQMGRRAGGLSA